MTSDAMHVRATAGLDEPGEPYLDLLQAARGVATHIVATPAEGLTGAMEYIHRASRELVSAVTAGDGGDRISTLAVGECLRRLGDAWPRLAQGTMQGEQVLAGEPTLWRRAMTEWPMGEYASMAAGFLIDNRLLGGQVVELGAGVGSCSALVAGHVGDGFVRTDLQPLLLKRQPLPGSVSRYDFNEPGPWRNLDAVFSVNAVHCAKNKAATLGYLYEMLRPGGVVVLGEGAPRTDGRGTPWPLNGFFGLFRGWWDVGGYLPRDSWRAFLTDAGFRNVGWAPRRAGAHDLGGLLWGER